jgi:FAD/FMN-containing dehydrogenase
LSSLLDPPTIRDFAGELIRPGDPGYDDARRVVNAAVDRRPALIARCSDAHDVAAALRHARAAGLAVTVRGGGHAPAGFAVADGALAVDLGRMRAVHVDPERRIARVQGGATWRELDAAAQEHGLAVTGARHPSVGVAGFTLGSGSGWLERKLGLAADSLRCARVVTADGDLVSAGADENAGLFWALRGGGASFGVVAELQFELAPVGPVVLGGMLGWPTERAPEIAAEYAALIDRSPDDLGGGLALLGAPPAPFVPASLHGAPIVAVIVLWTGDAAQGAEAIRPLRELGPAFDAVRPLPYTALQALSEPPAPLVLRTQLEAGFLSGLTAPAVAVLAAAAAGRPSPLCSVLLQPLGGAFGRVADDATPLGRRSAPWHWQAVAAWGDASGDSAARGWTGGLRGALAPWSAGESYPNFIAQADPARLAASYEPAVWERLRALRAEWDPDEVFAGGHAIPPRARRALAR